MSSVAERVKKSRLKKKDAGYLTIQISLKKSVFDKLDGISLSQKKSKSKIIEDIINKIPYSKCNYYAMCSSKIQSKKKSEKIKINENTLKKLEKDLLLEEKKPRLFAFKKKKKIKRKSEH